MAEKKHEFMFHERDHRLWNMKTKEDGNRIRVDIDYPDAYVTAFGNTLPEATRNAIRKLFNHKKNFIKWYIVNKARWTGLLEDNILYAEEFGLLGFIAPTRLVIFREDKRISATPWVVAADKLPETKREQRDGIIALLEETILKDLD